MTTSERAESRGPGAESRSQSAESRPLRTLLVDDETLARAQLRRLLGAAPDVDVIGESASGEEAVVAIEQLRPDLVFLDVQMPRGDGFSVIRGVGPARMPLTIFVTAYDEYAIPALRAQAIDYLVKPVDPADLGAALQRARERSRARRDESLAERLERLVGSAEPRYLRRLLAKTDGRVVPIPVDEVDWIEARDNYAVVHAGASAVTIRATLTALAEQLDPRQFARVHRSAIVNLARVREVQPWFRGDYVVILADGNRVPVSATYRDGFLGRLQRG
jgi:two-component system LytT family response regulator